MCSPYCKKAAGETDQYLLIKCSHNMGVLQNTENYFLRETRKNQQVMDYNNHLLNGLPDMFCIFVTGDLGILKPNHSG